ncbi:MAG: hypothetical protein PF694_04270 [Bacteroidetes bacterium]|nr:hypothetical protein [Bacteroidota bacterium]
MTKLVSLLFGLLMLVSLILPFQLMRQLQHEQAEARADALIEMNAIHAGKALKYIAIPKHELEGRGSRFVRIHATEFIWDGMMYDIVSAFPETHQTWFLVYPDHKETSILNQKIALAKAFNQDATVHSSTNWNSIVWHWISSAYCNDLPRYLPKFIIEFHYFGNTYAFLESNQIEHPPQLLIH